MNCHTCDHTMSSIGGAYWCSSCGSIAWGDADYTRDTPRLVSRAKLLVQEFKRGSKYKPEWYAIEVEECLNMGIHTDGSEVRFDDDETDYSRIPKG